MWSFMYDAQQLFILIEKKSTNFSLIKNDKNFSIELLPKENLIVIENLCKNK